MCNGNAECRFGTCIPAAGCVSQTQQNPHRCWYHDCCSDRTSGSDIWTMLEGCFGCQCRAGWQPPIIRQGSRQISQSKLRPLKVTAHQKSRIKGSHSPPRDKDQNYLSASCVPKFKWSCFRTSMQCAKKFLCNIAKNQLSVWHPPHRSKRESEFIGDGKVSPRLYHLVQV